MKDSQKEEYINLINEKLKGLDPALREFVKRNPGTEKLFLLDDDKFLSIVVNSANTLFREIEPQAKSVAAKLSKSIDSLDKNGKPKATKETPSE